MPVNLTHPASRARVRQARPTDSIATVKYGISEGLRGIVTSGEAQLGAAIEHVVVDRGSCRGAPGFLAR